MSEPFASAVDAQFTCDMAEAGVFTPAATGTPQALRVIRYDEPAGDFPSPGNVKRSVSFEIRQSELPLKPVAGTGASADRLATTDAQGNAESWRINQVLPLALEQVWRVWVERAA